MKTLKNQISEKIAAWKGKPGVAVTVRLADGEKVYACEGMANLTYDIPISEKSLFDIASVSKHFTGFALRLMIAEGKIDLDDSILKYLPEMPSQFAPIQIHHLIYHSSGLRGIYDLAAAAGFRRDDIMTREQILALVYRNQSLNYEPGTEFKYTNTGYILSAEIIRLITGKPFRAFLTDRVFQPLGMDTTMVQNDFTEIIPNLAESYTLDEIGRYRKCLNNSTYEGFSCVLTNVRDFGHWFDNFFEPKVGKEIIPLMAESRPIENGPENDYGFGLEIFSRQGHDIWMHSGGSAGYRSHMILMPKEKVGVAVMTNNASVNAEGLAFEILDILHPGIAMQNVSKGRPILSSDAPDAEGLLGYYVLDQIGLSRIYFEDGVLQIKSPIHPDPIKLMLLDDGSYMLDLLNVPITISRNDRGEVLSVSADTPDGRMSAEKIDLPTLDESTIREYTGRYFNDDLLSMMEITEQNGQPVIYSPHLPAVVLSPMQEDVFFSNTYGYNVVEFTRNDLNEVTGLRISANRSRDLAFQRV